MRGGKLASAGLVLACTFGLKHNAHAEPAYRMVFSDEFDGTTLNTSTWTAADNFTVPRPPGLLPPHHTRHHVHVSPPPSLGPTPSHARSASLRPPTPSTRPSTQHGNTELQLYVESAVAVADGVLRLTTQYDPALAASYGQPGYEYTSGWVDSGIAGAHSADPTTSEFAGVGGTAGTGVTDSASKFSQAFGKWEVRAKLPSYKAAEIWPAIWFMPAPEATNPPHLCWPVRIVARDRPAGSLRARCMPVHSAALPTTHHPPPTIHHPPFTTHHSLLVCMRATNQCRPPFCTSVGPCSPGGRRD